MRSRRPRPEDVDQAEELDAYLHGRYADHLMAHDRVVPAWAWVNVLGHGSDVLISAVALAQPGPHELPESYRAWFRVRKALAEEIVRVLADTGCTLDTLQHEVLQGVELELAGSSEWFVRGPLETACVVLEALSAFRDDR
jgi:hypothetical protein